MKTSDEGIAAAAYAPSEAVFHSRGTPVKVGLETDYPFRETLKLTVNSEHPATFPLRLRVPAWAEGATVRVGSRNEVRMERGEFHRIEREWSGLVEVHIRFPMPPKMSVRYNQAVAFERGPLVYSLKIGETWTRVNDGKPHRELPHADFEVRPSTPWNYGVVVDEKNLREAIRFHEKPVGETPFSPDGAGMSATVKGRRIPAWKLVHGWAGETVPGLYRSDEPLEELTLIPYGCTNIRITEFPKLEK
jgi:hypothetical protein